MFFKKSLKNYKGDLISVSKLEVLAFVLNSISSFVEQYSSKVNLSINISLDFSMPISENTYTCDFSLVPLQWDYEYLLMQWITKNNEQVSWSPLPAVVAQSILDLMIRYEADDSYEYLGEQIVESCVKEHKSNVVLFCKLEPWSKELATKNILQISWLHI